MPSIVNSPPSITVVERIKIPKLIDVIRTLDMTPPNKYLNINDILYDHAFCEIEYFTDLASTKTDKVKIEAVHFYPIFCKIYEIHPNGSYDYVIQLKNYEELYFQINSNRIRRLLLDENKKVKMFELYISIKKPMSIDGGFKIKELL